jgi:hypothetical protein
MNKEGVIQDTSKVDLEVPRSEGLPIDTENEKASVQKDQEKDDGEDQGEREDQLQGEREDQEQREDQEEAADEKSAVAKVEGQKEEKEENVEEG